MEVTIFQNDNEVTCRIAGSLDTVNAASFEDSRKKLEDYADRHICIDCSEMSYISSSGLRQFLMLRKTVEVKGGSLVLSGLNDEIKNIFAVTGFNRLFSIG